MQLTLDFAFITSFYFKRLLLTWHPDKAIFKKNHYSKIFARIEREQHIGLKKLFKNS